MGSWARHHRHRAQDKKRLAHRGIADTLADYILRNFKLLDCQCQCGIGYYLADLYRSSYLFIIGVKGRVELIFC